MSEESALTPSHELALLTRYRGLGVELGVDHWTAVVVALRFSGGTSGRSLAVFEALQDGGGGRQV